MRKKAAIGSAAAGALAGVALVVFSRGGDRVVSRLRQRPDDGEGPGPIGPIDLSDAALADGDVDERIADLGDGTVAHLVAAIPSLSRTELQRLRGYEATHKNRITVLRAIDRALS
ncbi:MAG TPA: hypothetical protein VML96_02660 [Egibacteraceae bacterium]|nr:hypothetical protein [Egibacteraceae bacterium]